MSPRVGPERDTSFETVLAAGRFARAVLVRGGGPLTIALVAARHPTNARAYRRLMNAARTREAVLAGPDSAAFAAALREQASLGPHLTQPLSLLTIAATDNEYLAGRHKQALRTNLRRATELGCTATVATHQDHIDFLNDLIARRRRQPGWEQLTDLFVDANLLVVAGREPGAKDSVVASTWICGEWARLDKFVRLNARKSTAQLMHLVQLRLIQELRARGVRSLIGGPALSIPPNLQYLAHLWGFEPAQIRVVDHSRVYIR